MNLNLETIFNIGSLVGSGASLYNSFQQGDAIEEQGASNRAIAEADARQAELSARDRERIRRYEIRSTVSEQKALYGASGVEVNAGSPLLVRAETIRRGNQDIRAIREAGRLSAYAARLGGENQARYASDLASATRTEGFTRVLSGAGGLYKAGKFVYNAFSATAAGSSIVASGATSLAPTVANASNLGAGSSLLSWADDMTAAASATPGLSSGMQIAGTASSIATSTGSSATSSATSALNSATNFLRTAPGMGIAAAVITGITTGDWGKAAVTGVATYAGATIGNLILPGIGGIIGGALGGMLGGSIGPKPSDKAQGAAIKFNTGTITKLGSQGGDKFSPSMRKGVDTVARNLVSMSKMIKQHFPGVKFRDFGITFGERDGLRVVAAWDGKGVPTERNAGYDQAAFAKLVSKGFADSIAGLPPETIKKIAKVNFSNRTLAKQQLQNIAAGIV